MPTVSNPPRSRRTILLAGVGLALVAGAVLVWQLRGDTPTTGGGAKGSGSAGDLLAARHAAHQAAPVDVTPASVSGRVTRKDSGAGIGGAVVTLAPADLGAEMFDTGSGSDRTVVVAAGPDGAWSAKDVAPGNYVVTAASSGFLPGSRSGVALVAGAKKTGIDLALEAGGTTVRGTVSDIGGGPIAEARVTARRDGVMRLKTSGAFSAITGADGTYTLTLPDGSWDAKASHPDYAADDKDFEVAGTALTIDFALVPGAVIRGQVVTRQDGSPVPGAVVIASKGRGSMGDGITTFADKNGEFTIKGLSGGAISLDAKARGVATEAPTVVELGIGEEATGVKVVVDRALSVSGFVVRKGKPTEGVPGVLIGIFSLAAMDGAIGHVPSGDDGYFEILGVRPGNYMIFALGGDVVPEIGKPVEVKDKDVTDVVIEMDAGRTLSGKVTPPAVAGLALEIDPENIGLGNMFEVAKAALVVGESDTSGAFTLKNVPMGTFTLVARAGDGRTGKIEVKVADADQTGLVIPLEPRLAIAGKVVDANGAPVPGVKVRANAKREGMKIRLNEPDGALTGADGAFRVVGLEPGKFEVAVSDEQGKLAWADSAHKDKPREPIEVEVQGVDVTGLTLTVEARDGVIRGVVLGPDGAPAPDTWVAATFIPPQARAANGGPGERQVTVSVGSSGASAEDTTDDAPEDDLRKWTGMSAQPPVLTGPDGKFTITRLRRGTYKIGAEGMKGRAQARKSGVNTGDTVTLKLELLGSLSGVVTAAGAPVADYTIACTGPTETARRHVIAANGAYAFDRLSPGKYKCIATCPAGPATGDVTVTSAAAKLDLTVGTWGTVTGKVVDARTGEAMSGLKVVAMGEGSEPSDLGDILLGGGPTTNGDGRFEVGKQGPGKRNLIIFDGGITGIHAVAHKDFTLAAGQKLDLGTIKGLPPRDGPAGTLGLVAKEASASALEVTAVTAGGPAAKAGVKVGDTIVAVDGHKVSDLSAEIAKDMLETEHVAAGQVVKLDVGRGRTVSITAAPAAP